MAEQQVTHSGSWRRLGVTIAALALVAAACGSDDDGGSADATTAAPGTGEPGTSAAAAGGGSGDEPCVRAAFVLVGSSTDNGWNYQHMKGIDQVKEAASHMDLAERLMEDIDYFRGERKVDRLVMVWCGSTEAYEEPSEVHADLDQQLAAVQCLDETRPRRREVRVLRGLGEDLHGDLVAADGADDGAELGDGRARLFHVLEVERREGMDRVLGLVDVPAAVRVDADAALGTEHLPRGAHARDIRR